MGAQIAAHFANAGVPALLLDVTADAAAQGLKRARGAEARPVLHPGHLEARSPRRLRRGPGAACATPTGSSKRSSSSSTSSGAARARWMPSRRPGSIVSSNTSGIPIAALAEGRSDDFRRHWLGTHFFNPPRYLQLLEIIPTPETHPVVVETVTAVRRHPARQGRRDREGLAELHRQPPGALRRGADPGEGGGRRVHDRGGRRDHRPAIGRPKSATFRTLDLAGVDILGHVVRNLHERLPDERGPRRPSCCRRSSSRCSSAGLTGEKAGQGFYKRVKRHGRRVGDPDARSRRRSSTGRGSRRGCRRSTRPSRSADAGERMRTLFDGTDRVGRSCARRWRRRSSTRRSVTPDDRPLARRRRPGDALGLRLGARARSS